MDNKELAGTADSAGQAVIVPRMGHQGEQAGNSQSGAETEVLMWNFFFPEGSFLYLGSFSWLYKAQPDDPANI